MRKLIMILALSVSGCFNQQFLPAPQGGSRSREIRERIIIEERPIYQAPPPRPYCPPPSPPPQHHHDNHHHHDEPKFKFELNIKK